MELQRPEKKKSKAPLIILLLLLGIAAGAFYIWNYVPRGSVKDRTVTIAGVPRYGKCVGPTLRGLPNGENNFYGQDGGLYIFQGTFVDGVSDGTGHLTDGDAVVSFEGQRLKGEYKGDVVAGVYEGTGSFTARDSEMRRFTYTGEWKNGRPEGQGAVVYDDDAWYRLEGSFENGCFTPTVYEWYAANGTHPQMPYEITAHGAEYLQQNGDVFVGNLFENSKQIPINKSFSYEAYAANPEAYDEGVFRKLGLTIVQVIEEEALMGYDCTTILAVDNEQNVYFVDVLGKSDLKEGNGLILYALPLDYSTYPSLDGEAWAIRCAAVCVR